MTRITNEEAIERIEEAYDTGGVANGAWAAAAAGLQFICEVYRDAGDFLGERGGFANPFTPVAQTWCPRSRIDPPPQLPEVEGGQCLDVFYTVSGTTFNTDSGFSNPFFITGQGPIRGIVGGISPGGTNYLGVGFGPSYDSLNGNNGAVVNWLPDDPTGGAWNAVITGITRDDGLPDNCGNAPPRPRPRPIPPSEYKDPDYRPPFAPQFNFDVKIKPQINVGVDVNFSPSIDIEVNGIDISFDLGGVDINFGGGNGAGGGSGTLPPGAGDDPTNPPQPPKPPTPGVGGGGECPDPCTPTDLSEVLELLEDIKECACPPETVLLTTATSGSSGTLTTGDNLPAFAASLVIDSPVNPATRVQFGGGGAPDVYFLGWFSWGSAASGQGERIPISFLRNRFKAPPDCDRFSYTLTNGNTGTAVLAWEFEP